MAVTCSMGCDISGVVLDEKMFYDWAFVFTGFGRVYAMRTWE